MKVTRKIISLLTVFAVLLSFSVFGVIQSYAHYGFYGFEYESCDYETENGKIWNYFDDYTRDENGNRMYIQKHLDSDIINVTYYFEPTSEDGKDTWTHYDGREMFSQSVANEIKATFAASMEKWNNVYFYSYDSAGNVIKRKIINIQEGTASNHNLSIYPDMDARYPAALRFNNYYISESEDVIDDDIYIHRHYDGAIITVEPRQHQKNVSATQEHHRAKTGAHEIGHLLGLVDADPACDIQENYHHTELLMGYGDDSVEDIAYQDIAGVAITRGFHTDADHKWLVRAKTYGYKLICTICNAVEDVSNLDGITYDTYGICGENNHTLSSGNMMAVASYGTYDYYKCKYCRYVAPFESKVAQNYVLSTHSTTHHKYTNNVQGLNYTILEPHTMSGHECTLDCGYNTHTFGTPPSQHDYTFHKYTCTSCGGVKLERHVLTGTGRFRPCTLCGYMKDTYSSPGIMSNWLRSANGSYIMPDGVVVLVDADIEAYFNGTLVFTRDEHETE